MNQKLIRCSNECREFQDNLQINLKKDKQNGEKAGRYNKDEREAESNPGTTAEDIRHDGPAEINRNFARIRNVVFTVSEEASRPSRWLLKYD